MRAGLAPLLPFWGESPRNGEGQQHEGQRGSLRRCTGGKNSDASATRRCFFFFFSRRELLLCFWHAAYRAMMMTDTKEGKRRGRHVHTEGTLCGRKMPQMDESQQIMVAGQS